VRVFSPFLHQGPDRLNAVLAPRFSSRSMLDHRYADLSFSSPVYPLTPLLHMFVSPTLSPKTLSLPSPAVLDSEADFPPPLHKSPLRARSARGVRARLFVSVSGECLRTVADGFFRFPFFLAPVEVLLRVRRCVPARRFTGSAGVPTRSRCRPFLQGRACAGLLFPVITAS